MERMTGEQITEFLEEHPLAQPLSFEMDNGSALTEVVITEKLRDEEEITIIALGSYFLELLEGDWILKDGRRKNLKVVKIGCRTQVPA